MNQTFLLVDDDPDDKSLFCEALNDVASNIDCQTAESGMELFKKLSEIKPDVIFLDINMPILTGWDCLKKLKSIPGFDQIPVIMYSTSAAQKDISKSYELGAALFISKPEDFIELSGILKIISTGLQDVQIEKLRKYQNVKVR